ncbi:NUDIX domain-containing protein [Streptomyces katrae]|uniref:NUDIX domain-containing protein n=1 Tax=Streptomyces katrae TaxID=68223 RepID=UPI001FDEEA25|nr:NUDIX domain-containing protein [Streptomyces katrae]
MPRPAWTRRTARPGSTRAATTPPPTGPPGPRPSPRRTCCSPTRRAGCCWCGGGVDSDLGETPRAAAAREVREEIGLDLAPGRLLAVNWSHRPGYPARVRFLYDGGVLDAAALDRIRLEPTELLEWRTAPREELRGLVKPHLRRQIKACLDALAEGSGPLELHRGRPA